ncbi:calcium-binding protein [Leisingera sp. MMG026]|uniref:calcium-binding protein n=1 Tax=Leisingera sp. MMG026 TaxID=2909982 RepID=UPI0023B241C9|nr:calcium-binding protein [Leisingera sp. MMG026]
MTTYTLSGFGVGKFSLFDPAGGGWVQTGLKLRLTVPDGEGFTFSPTRVHEDKVDIEPGDHVSGLTRTQGEAADGTQYGTLDAGYSLSEISWDGGKTVVLTMHSMSVHQAVYALSGDPLPEIGSYSDYAAFEGSITQRSPVTTSLQPGQVLEWALGTVDVSQRDRLIGTDRDDTLKGGAGADTIKGGAGDDVVKGGSGSDKLAGISGDDTLSGQRGEDRLNGGRGRDSLDGGRGDDALKGGKGRDTLDGGAGHDTLHGGSGRDTLDGGYGDDLLTGGSGDDTFVFFDVFGDDTITDFDASSSGEKIDLSTVSSITDMTDLLDNHIREDGENVVIEDVHGSTITLENVQLADLDETDFNFELPEW